MCQRGQRGDVVVVVLTEPSQFHRPFTGPAVEDERRGAEEGRWSGKWRARRLVKKFFPNSNWLVGVAPTASPGSLSLRPASPLVPSPHLVTQVETGD